MRAAGDDDVRGPIVLLGLLAVGVTLWLLRDTLIPFAVALLLSYILRPAVVVLTRLLAYLTTCCQAHCALTCQKRTAVWWNTHCSCAALSRRCRGSPSAPVARPPAAADTDGETDADDSTPLLRGAAPVAGGGADSVPAVVVLKAADEAPTPYPSVPHTPAPGTTPGTDNDGNVDFYYVRCTRLTAVLLTTALAVGVLAILVLIIADSVQNFQEQYWDIFSKQFETVMRRFVDWMKRNMHVDASSLLTIADTLAKEFTASATLMGIASAAVAVVLTLLLMMFLLLDERFDADEGGTQPPTAARTSTWSRLIDARTRMWREIDDSIHRYIVAKTAVSAMMGLLVFLVLGPMLHVKLAHLFGVLTFFLNFIPNLVSCGAAAAAVRSASPTPPPSRSPHRRVPSSPPSYPCQSSCWTLNSPPCLRQRLSSCPYSSTSPSATLWSHMSSPPSYRCIPSSCCWHWACGT